MTDHSSGTFYGIASIGTKGQIVIPVDAREAMGVGPGDKLLVVGRSQPGGMVCLVPVERAEKFVEELTSKLQGVQDAIEAAKEETKG